jgi:hypothetical protein
MRDGIVAFDLGIKTLATGFTDQGRCYHIGGFKGYRWYNKQLDKIRSKRDRCKKKSRRYIQLSKVYKRVSERKRNKLGRWSFRSKSTRPPRSETSGASVTAWSIMTGDSTALCKCLGTSVCITGKNSL